MRISTLIVLALALASLAYLGLKWHAADEAETLTGETNVESPE